MPKSATKLGWLVKIKPILFDAAVLNAVENKIPNISFQSRKQIMMQKYQTLRLNFLLLLIKINLQVKY